MSGQIKVRLYGTYEIRVPLNTEIEVDDFSEWMEQQTGRAFDWGDIDTDDIVSFINDDPDYEMETASQFPPPDAQDHELLAFTIDEAEVLPIPEDE